MKKASKEKIEIDFNLLQNIAHYYEFPVAVFLLPSDTDKFPNKTTRYKELIKDYKKLQQIKDILTEGD